MGEGLDTLGPYRLVRKLAQGGMAEVFLAVQHGAAGFERPAVVKRMLPELARHAEYRELFVQEAKLMAALSHPNVVGVLDFGEERGTYFLALEFVDGADLGRALKAMGRLSPPLAACVGSGVLRALHHVHTRTDARGEPLNIVHRDATPHNVLLGRAGEVKLGDFGIAKLPRGPSRTAPGMTRGKLRYMSPEQAAGKPLDARADLFSVGVLLHECVVGRNPFGATSDAQLLKLVRDASVGPLEEVAQVAGKTFAAVVGRALARHPGDRFSTADEMERALIAAAPPSGPREVAALVAAVVGAPAAAGPEGGSTATTEKVAHSPLSAALLGTEDE
ncbi:MAG TPA: serine/threonine-protein kinase [Myxococcales bacterium]|nr:serine/threonine-protein kinase [Myxococcales bacterium]